MTYAKNWAEIAERAKDFIEFLQGDSCFSKPYKTDNDQLIITDRTVALNYLLEDSEDQFSSWENLFSTQFPEDFSFELSLRIHYNLSKTNYYGFFKKNLNGLLEKLEMNDGICVAEEMMEIHFDKIFNCYANNYFPPIWQNSLKINLDGGLSCDWSELYPEGEIVVFSNF